MSLLHFVSESLDDKGNERTKKIAQSYTFAPYFYFSSKFPPV
jgi:hypothetical protein